MKHNLGLYWMVFGVLTVFLLLLPLVTADELQPEAPLTWLKFEQTAYPAAFSPDGKLLAFVRDDNEIQLWDYHTKKLRRSIQTGYNEGLGFGRIAISRGGVIIAAAYSRHAPSNAFVRAWRIQDGHLLYEREFEDIFYSRDGRSFYTVALNGGISRQLSATVTTWIVDTGKQLRVTQVLAPPDLRFQHNIDGTSAGFRPKTPCTVSADGRWFAVTLWEVIGDGYGRENNRAKGILLCNLQTGVQQVVPPQWELSDISSISFSPDGKILTWSERQYGEGSDYVVYLRDTQSGRIVLRRKGSDFGGLLMFSPDSSLILTAFFDEKNRSSELRLWDVKTGKLTMSLPLARNSLFAHDGLSLITSSQDNTIQRWRLRHRLN